MSSEVVSFDLKNEDETEAMGKQIAQCLTFPLILIFQGTLGAGKTTLIRAMLRALGVSGAIKSPTFSIVESYFLPQSSREIHHFDLYRIEHEEELELIGFRDYFTDHAICCIEWPERASLEHYDAAFLLTAPHPDCRQLNVHANSQRGDALLSCLMRNYA